MAAVIDSVVGSATANSYCSLAEAQSYYDARLPLAGWDDADSQVVLLLMATRVLESYARPSKMLVMGPNGPYYRVRRQWTGAPATTTQRLAWPRTGMYDGNGNLIPSNVIPQELKDAESELAGQLGNEDRTLDNDIIVQGISSLRAGPISLTFNKDILAQVIPDAVWNLLPPWWLTDEIYESAFPVLFETI